MEDLGVIDRFLNVYARYIDSGFGLLGGEVAFLSATLIVIDVTLAGLFWAMGGNDDVIAKLIKKILYVGAFAFIIGHFNALAGIVFRSFAGLGLLASGSTVSEAELLRPGRLAEVGVDAGRPMLEQIERMSGFPDVFLNLDSITVLFLAWLVVILSFFVLAVQLFVTLIEFKLTTLAGFVLVPFALWNKTAFLAEKVLGNVMSSGVKVLVLAVIVGIGAGLFDEFTLPPGTAPSIDHALAMMLGSLTLFGLGLFGPGMATGLVSGGPQLGAGAAAGVALAATGVTTATGAAAVGAARIAGSALGAGTRGRAPQASHVPAAAMAGGKACGPSGGSPAWVHRLQQRQQQVARGLTTAAHVARSADRGGGGAGPTLQGGD
ncbi:P-type conjugative transfer protein TrbL [Pseudoxanthomonas sp. UTMC 1351]|uniref:P-type conjugative transfer protein TrbL n=1 Tax=Pseudoxanthomonas sp. UTMC 1351 TaxID=2695853 RepID=UPI0034CF19E6